MVISDTRTLTEYRLEVNKELGHPVFDGTPMELYGVYHHLMNGVTEFTRVTKKHVYDTHGERHDYPSRAAGYTMFTSPTEAWRFFREKLNDKQDRLDAHYKTEMISINLAKQHLTKCVETHPEFII